jgi:hypothetical protein
MNVLTLAQENSALQTFLESSAPITSQYAYALRKNTAIYTPLNTVIGTKVSGGDLTASRELTIPIPRYGILERIVLRWKFVVAASGQATASSMRHWLGANVIKRIDLKARDKVIASITNYGIIAAIEAMPVDEREVWRGLCNSHGLGDADSNVAHTHLIYTPIPFSMFRRTSNAFNVKFTEPLELQVVLSDTALEALIFHHGTGVTRLTTTSNGDLRAAKDQYEWRSGAAATLLNATFTEKSVEPMFYYTVPGEKESARLKKDMLENRVSGQPKMQVSQYTEATVTTTSGTTRVNGAGAEISGAADAEYVVDLRCPYPVFKTAVFITSPYEDQAQLQDGRFDMPGSVELLASGVVQKTWTSDDLLLQAADGRPTGLTSYGTTAGTYTFVTPLDSSSSSLHVVQLYHNAGNNNEGLDNTGFVSFKNLAAPQLRVKVTGAKLNSKVRVVHFYNQIVSVAPDDGQVHARALS